MDAVINEKTAKLASRLGPRAYYGASMLNAIVSGSDFLLLSGDLGRSSGLDRLRNEHPDHFINCGIAEQNMVGFAAGLAREGFTIFASSFAPFISMRACEQVRMNLGYMQEPVNLVALGSGLAMGFLGNSHFGLEDIAIMRSMPNLVIVSPADAISIPKFIAATAECRYPCYLRLTGVPGSPSVYTEDYDLELGRAILLTPKCSGIAIIASGSTVAQSIEARQILNTRGIDSSVYDFHTVWPLDESALLEIQKSHSHVVVVEEHFEISGLGSAILEFFSSRNLKAPILRVGIENTYVSPGDYFWMLEDLGLDGTGIATRIEKWLEDD